MVSPKKVICFNIPKKTTGTLGVYGITIAIVPKRINNDDNIRIIVSSITILYNL